MTNFEISIRFFLALAVILATCRAVGFLARAIAQPQVVGEMIAGVLLGPSLLALISPQASAYLFPKEVMPVLYCASQVGLVLYMFTIGMEFDRTLLLRRATSAAAVSLAGILVPFALAVLIAFPLLREQTYFNPGVKYPQAAIFLGAAISITAFPMLARIIYERGLTGSTLGALALAAGSLDDAAAWCFLALVLAMFKNDASIAILAVLGGVAYAAFTLLVIRPALRPIARSVERHGDITPTLLGVVLVLLMLAAYTTDALGIYAVFGAFILGLAMPRGPATRAVERRIEPLTVGLLLPLFFVYSGLNTRITLVNTPELWLVALALLAVSCLGKGVACAAAAKISGEPTRDALAIGALMNARGLMELILLNIGLEHGLITPTLFSMLVIMAIATTLMATPLFNLVMGKRHALATS